VVLSFVDTGHMQWRCSYDIRARLPQFYPIIAIHFPTIKLASPHLVSYRLSIPLPQQSSQLLIILAPLYFPLISLRLLLLCPELLPRLPADIPHERVLERAPIVIQPLHCAVPPHALFVPVDLSAICFAMLLCVEFGGADRGTRVDEEEAGHG
jgi:hypothetical protein